MDGLVGISDAGKEPLKPLRIEVELVLSGCARQLVIEVVQHDGQNTQGLERGCVPEVQRCPGRGLLHRCHLAKGEEYT
jgi:hypothetical protein